MPNTALSALTNAPARLRSVVRSPWLCNGIAVAPGGAMFLSLPRFAGHDDTPSLARVARDGSLEPFPGGAWNSWKPGADARECFVMVNALHVFADGTLWVVDQGCVDGISIEGAAKLVRLDISTGNVLAILRFPEEILPPGAMMNDLRVHDNMIYITDSGVGGIIIHDLSANRTIRRLSAHPLLRKAADAKQKGANGRLLEDGSGHYPAVHSDMLELDADGAWLYWSTPTGPVRRVATAMLLDEELDDAVLAMGIQTVSDIPTIGGTAIDTLGNLYLSDVERRRIVVLTPQGRKLTLVEDDRLVTPDAIFIDENRQLFVPAAQLEDIAPNAAGVDRTSAPWEVLSLKLPRQLDGVMLGDAVTGAPPARTLSDVRGIEHIAMTVPDMEAAISFLQRAFGATVLYRHIKATEPPVTAEKIGHVNGLPASARMNAGCLMRLADGPNVELFEISGEGRHRAANIEDIGLVHFSVVVRDMLACTRRFAEAGGKLLDGPNDLGANEAGRGNQNRFGRMPWGTWVEFMTFASPLRYEPGSTQQRRLPYPV